MNARDYQLAVACGGFAHETFSDGRIFRAEKVGSRHIKSDLGGSDDVSHAVTYYGAKIEFHDATDYSIFHHSFVLHYHVTDEGTCEIASEDWEAALEWLILARCIDNRVKRSRVRRLAVAQW